MFESSNTASTFEKNYENCATMQIHEKAYKSNDFAAETNLQLLFDIPPDVDFKPLDSHISNDGWKFAKMAVCLFI